MNASSVEKEGQRRLAVVRDTVNALFEHYFPDLQPHRTDDKDNEFFIGIDAHPTESGHAVMHSIPPEGYENMYPANQHYSFTLPAINFEEGESLSSLQQTAEALEKDLNRLFTGKEEGENITITVAIRDGKETKGPLGRVRLYVGHPDKEGNLNLYLEGSVNELYTKMQENLNLHQDLKAFVPKGRQLPPH